MEVKVTRRRDEQIFKGVKSITIIKKGWLLPNVHIGLRFKEGASTHYISKEHNLSWEINHHTIPGMGMDGCIRIEIKESQDV